MNTKDYDEVDHEEVQAKGEIWDKYREHLFESYMKKCYIKKDNSYSQRIKPISNAHTSKNVQKVKDHEKMYFEENWDKKHIDDYKKY